MKKLIGFAKSEDNWRLTHTSWVGVTTTKWVDKMKAWYNNTQNSVNHRKTAPIIASSMSAYSFG